MEVRLKHQDSDGIKRLVLHYVNNNRDSCGGYYVINSEIRVAGVTLKHLLTLLFILNDTYKAETNPASVFDSDAAH